MKSENIENLVKAVINVMTSVKGVEKNLQVGEGSYGYKGVSDQDVKKTVGDAMAKNGLCIIPVEIDETSDVTSWDEQYNGNIKRKQSVFTKVKTTYLLCHESGEYILIKGDGHGVDSQDKSAGKATTYALKYALLYTFLVPTGKIDDADVDHSDKMETPTLNIEVYRNLLRGAKTKAELKQLWISCPSEIRPYVEADKDKIKNELEQD